MDSTRELQQQHRRLVRSRRVPHRRSVTCTRDRRCATRRSDTVAVVRRAAAPRGVLGSGWGRGWEPPRWPRWGQGVNGAKGEKERDQGPASEAGCGAADDGTTKLRARPHVSAARSGAHLAIERSHQHAEDLRRHRAGRHRRHLPSLTPSPLVATRDSSLSGDVYLHFGAASLVKGVEKQPSNCKDLSDLLVCEGFSGLIWIS